MTAAHGIALPHGQLLANSVQGHHSYQKAEVFLKNGGQKGPQIDFLRPGTFNIFTDMFNIQLAEAAQVTENQIGIIEAMDGKPMMPGDVVGTTPDMNTHNSYQDGQAFLDSNGFRGPQTTVLRPGRYYVNPYLFNVTLKPVTIVKQGEVGVLVSNIGMDPEAENAAHADDTAGAQRHVVPEGYRGIQRNVLRAGHVQHQPARLYRHHRSHDDPQRRVVALAGR